jgi:hypothetical protein
VPVISIVICMNITDNIVDNFVEKLQSNGIAIQSHAGIDWIEKIIRRLPARFPPTFMSLISRYIFDEFEVEKLWFFANRGDQDWEELSQAVFRDKIIFKTTSTKGFLYFSRSADGSYDPICFDMRDRKKREYPVVRLDHESILISETIKIIENVYPSLLEFMKDYSSR